jgi:hypothetical protein
MNSSPSSKFHNKFLTFVQKNFDLMVIFILIIATLIINYRMIKQGLNGTGDVRWHLTWIQHFYRQITEGVWYPRWLSGTNFGYGSPTFVFYPPLIYYLGSILRLIGLNIEQTMTILLTLAIFLSGLTFYIYGINRWDKLSALAGALYFMTTPGIIIYANGGVILNLFAVALIPLGAYLTEQSMTKPKARIPLAIFWTIIAFTHTPSFLLWTIAFLGYLLFFLSKYSYKSVLSTLLSSMLGWGMASIYLIPAILEKSSVNIDYPRLSKGGFEMLDLLELFKSGISDITNKQLLAILTMAIICFLSYWQNQSKIKETFGWLIFIGIVLFFISNLSWPIWRSSITLQTVEDSWRIGGLLYFGIAGLSALTVSSIFKQKLPLKLFLSVIIASTIMINFHYGYVLSRQNPTLHSGGKGRVFVKEWLETIFYDPYSDKLIDVPEFRPLIHDKIPSNYPRERYTDAGIPYIEKGSASFPIPALGEPRYSLIQGRAEIILSKWENYEKEFKITVTETSVIKIRTYTYPAWHLYVNNQSYPILQADDGTILLNLYPGSYQVLLRYEWTPAFTAGFVLSFLSFGALMVLKRIYETSKRSESIT